MTQETKEPASPSTLVSSARPHPRRAMIQFVVIYGALLGLYFAFSTTDIFASILEPHLRFNAWVSAKMLGLLGTEVELVDKTIRSPRFAVQVWRGCDALDPSAIFAAGILAFPAPWKMKLPGIAAGVLLLVVINFVRIVSLFYTGVYFPNFFDTMHHDIWQGLFIFLALGFWMTWAWWSTSSEGPLADAAS